MADGGIGETALIGMAVGGVGSALTGGDPLKGALMGGALGGIGGLAGQGLPVGADAANTAATFSQPNLFEDQIASINNPVTNDFMSRSAAQAIVDPVTGQVLPQSISDPSLWGSADSIANADPNAVNWMRSQNAASYGGSGIAPSSADLSSGTFDTKSFDANPNSVGGNVANAAASGSSGGIGSWFSSLSPMQKAAMGLGAYGLFNQMAKPNLLPGYTPPSAASYGLGRTLAAGYQPVRPMAVGGLASATPTRGIAPADLTAQSTGTGLDALAAKYGYSPQMIAQSAQDYGLTQRNFADGGPTGPSDIYSKSGPGSAANTTATQGDYDNAVANVNAIGNALSSLSIGSMISNALGLGDSAGSNGAAPGSIGGVNNSAGQDAVSTDSTSGTGDAASADAKRGGYTQNGRMLHMAQGGIAQLSVGGKLLSGNGDGMSDSIKANIGGKQEARLGDGEFVVPADVVSHLGNGSTDAGAKQLYSMMDKVRQARTGRKAQGKQINAQKYLPA
jgi:hypothetical protein